MDVEVKNLLSSSSELDDDIEESKKIPESINSSDSSISDDEQNRNRP
jgi:hypothetical protein